MFNINFLSLTTRTNIYILLLQCPGFINFLFPFAYKLNGLQSVDVILLTSIKILIQNNITKFLKIKNVKIKMLKLVIIKYSQKMTHQIKNYEYNFKRRKNKNIITKRIK